MLSFTKNQKTSNDILFSFVARTDIGMRRSANQDAFLVTNLGNNNPKTKADFERVGEQGSLLIVADGMGGAAAGDMASRIAVDATYETLQYMSSNSNAMEKLNIAVERANKCIYARAQQDLSLNGMGTTITAALVQGNQATIAQVGDSRAYLIREEDIFQLTKDQSLAQYLVDIGKIKHEQMHTVKQNILMQALGVGPEVEATLSSVELCRDDFLLLCSDGLSTKVTSKEMAQIVKDSPDPNVACERLIDLANERGGDDNITVIIARFTGEALRASGRNATTGRLSSQLVS